jgi:hypothetical protein
MNMLGLFIKCTYRTYSMLLKILPFTLYTTCKSFLSTGFAKHIMAILRILHYNGSLVTWTVVSLTTAKFNPQSYVTPTASLPVCLKIKHPSGAYDRIFITIRQLRICWCGTLSLTRGRVCRLLVLLALASAGIFGFESRGTRDHILLSKSLGFQFFPLLRLAGLWWKCSI